MFNELLAKIGLSEGEVDVYDFLLRNGETTAGKIIEAVGLKRGNVYNILERLAARGLVEQTTKNKVAHFRLEHPSQLEKHIEDTVHEIAGVRESFKSALPALISQYKLSHHKPAVSYFEGLEGVQKVLEDSLTSKTEIYSYADIESIVKYIDEVNKDYVAQREKLQIKKRAILLDTPFARKYLADYHKAVTDMRFIKYDAPPFQTVMQIYDGKISYITLDEQRMIGVIIEDQHIYEIHSYLFEFLWDKAQIPEELC